MKTNVKLGEDLLKPFYFVEKKQIKNKLRWTKGMRKGSDVLSEPDFLSKKERALRELNMRYLYVVEKHIQPESTTARSV